MFKENAICGTQYGTCTSRYSSGGNLSFGAIAGIVLGTIALILLITGLNYCARQRQQLQQVQRLSQVRSVYNPFSYTAPPTSFSRSTYNGPLPPSKTLASISATVTDSPA